MKLARTYTRSFQESLDICIVFSGFVFVMTAQVLGWTDVTLLLHFFGKILSGIQLIFQCLFASFSWDRYIKVNSEKSTF